MGRLLLTLERCRVVVGLLGETKIKIKSKEDNDDRANQSESRKGRKSRQEETIRLKSSNGAVIVCRRYESMETIMTTNTNPPFQWRLIVHQCPLYNFQHYIIANYGLEAYDRARVSQGQTILLIVSHEDMLTFAIFLLDPY